MGKKATKEVQAILDKYQYDQSIRKHANQHYWGVHKYFREITSKADVARARQNVVGRIETYKKVYPLVSDDIEDMEKALGRYEDAVKKVLQCYSHDAFDFDYSAEGLIELINDIEKFEKQISEIHFRKMCQD